MGIDIRLPLGLMFSLLGAVLVIAGMVTDEEIYAPSLGFNINLWWGLVLLMFGIVIFTLGRRGTSSFRLAEASVEGRKIEEMEHRSATESAPDEDAS